MPTIRHRNRSSLPSSLVLLALGLAPVALVACDGWGGPCADERCGEAPCPASETGCPREAVPATGEVTLLARATYDDYEAATVSFELATVLDTERARNDWDLLFGNDQEPGADLLCVNTVTDDRSFLVDLGPMAFEDVPETVDLAAYPTGYWGEHDCLWVVVGHTYLVRTLDSDSRLYAAFRVTAHVPDQQVTLTWVRSREPDRFLLPLTRRE